MKTAPKKILFLTSTRADFGKIKPLLTKVQKAPEFETHIFVTGMHMLKKYGATVDEVKKCGFKNIFPYFNQTDSNGSQMDLVLAKTIEGLGFYVREFSPDLIVVHGDRSEALAGAIVGALNNILVAHIEGGEVSGTVDELIRHAVTKLSHLHFVANASARNRLLQLGEKKETIYVIGSPDVDIMKSKNLPSLSTAKKRYKISFKEYSIVAYHPVTTELDAIEKNIQNIIEALQESKRNFIVIYPNNDSGSEIILKKILTLEKNPHFRVIPSMRFEHFLTILKHSRAIIGNSSAGVREAPVFGVPTINIGSRQKNRFKYRSIVDIPEKSETILKALENLPKAVSPSLNFGDGHSAKGFMAAIRSQALWQTSCQKHFQDLRQ